jgi:hypothetical protein
MHVLEPEIARLQDAIALYDRVKPCTDGSDRERLLWHRDLDLRILAEYQLRLAKCPEALKVRSAPTI